MPGTGSVSIGCRCVHKPVVRKRPVPNGGSKENAPSRWSLRPTIRLTSAEATVTRRVINLRHSVLGASRTLGGGLDAVKRRSSALVANCDVFFSHRVALRIDELARVSVRKKGPGTCPAANSPSRERFRPPSRRTFRFRVLLLGGLRPTGVPCSAQRHSMQIRTRRSRSCPKETRANCEGASGSPSRSAAAATAVCTRRSARCEA